MPLIIFTMVRKSETKMSFKALSERDYTLAELSKIYKSRGICPKKAYMKMLKGNK